MAASPDHSPHSRRFDRVEILHRLRAVEAGEMTLYERELEEQLEALQDAVDDAILVFEDTKWWEAYHHLLSPLPSHPATYRDGDAIKGRSGWFWSEAEGRPVWNPASESLS